MLALNATCALPIAGEARQIPESECVFSEQKKVSAFRENRPISWKFGITTFGNRGELKVLKSLASENFQHIRPLISIEKTGLTLKAKGTVFGSWIPSEYKGSIMFRSNNSNSSSESKARKAKAETKAACQHGIRGSASDPHNATQNLCHLRAKIQSKNLPQTRGLC